MKPRDVFDIIVRTIGLFLIIYDAFLISVVLFELVGLPVKHTQTTVVDALYALVFLGAGLVCLFRASAIARFFYKEEKNLDRPIT